MMFRWVSVEWSNAPTVGAIIRLSGVVRSGQPKPLIFVMSSRRAGMVFPIQPVHSPVVCS